MQAYNQLQKAPKKLTQAFFGLGDAPGLGKKTIHEDSGQPYGCYMYISGHLSPSTCLKEGRLAHTLSLSINTKTSSCRLPSITIASKFHLDFTAHKSNFFPYGKSVSQQVVLYYHQSLLTFAVPTPPLHNRTCIHVVGLQKTQSLYGKPSQRSSWTHSRPTETMEASLRVPHLTALVN